MRLNAAPGHDRALSKTGTAMAINWKTAVAITACLLAACGGGADRTKAQVRLVNASSGYAQLDLRVDDQLRQGAVAYGAAEGYVEVEPSKAASTISSVGSATPLISFTPAVSEKKYYTLLAYGAAGALRQQPLDDNAGAPDTGRALLRVFNAASDAGGLDIYLTGTGDALDTAVAIHSGAAFGTLGAWITVNSANWRLRATAAGSKTDVRLDVPVLSLPSKQLATLVLTPGAGGVLVNALVLVQQGAITRQDSQQARVRLAAVVADSGTVGAQVGTTTMAAGNGSPSLGDYLLLPAGVSAVAVTVNGQAVAAPSFTLVPGHDYTLMVHGPLVAARVSWIEDDNRLPSDVSRAKLRLINGVSDSTAPLAMTLDFASVASAVAVGTASPYASVAPTSGGGTDGRLLVTATGVTTPVFTATDQILRASANYSVLLVGRQAPPTGIVRRDR